MSRLINFCSFKRAKEFLVDLKEKRKEFPEIFRQSSMSLEEILDEMQRFIYGPDWNPNYDFLSYLCYDHEGKFDESKYKKRQEECHKRAEEEAIGPEVEAYGLMILEKMLSLVENFQDWKFLPIKTTAVIKTEYSNFKKGIAKELVEYRTQTSTLFSPTENISLKQTVRSYHVKRKFSDNRYWGLIWSAPKTEETFNQIAYSIKIGKQEFPKDLSVIFWGIECLDPKWSGHRVFERLHQGIIPWIYDWLDGSLGQIYGFISEPLIKAEKQKTREIKRQNRFLKKTSRWSDSQFQKFSY